MTLTMSPTLSPNITPFSTRHSRALSLRTEMFQQVVFANPTVVIKIPNKSDLKRTKPLTGRSRSGNEMAGHRACVVPGGEHCCSPGFSANSLHLDWLLPSQFNLPGNVPT